MDIRRLLVAPLVAPLLAVPVAAQSYTPGEREVWSVIEGCWDAWDGRHDIDAWSSDCFHDNATFFHSPDATPFRKSWSLKAGPLFFERHDAERSTYDLRPLAITLYGDVAVVHYFARMVLMVDGQVESVTHKRTETLLRQGGKWMVIGVHVTPGTG